ncbi:MAG: hypothetical protein AUH85_16125 [Chloroflexi bacterium 13_1_40CM_4_68_4]|nr:MAG: hypothetical protein AUH85_16125 [Chloroflexi bacterium 13_1_40CM_4_68_4]
MSLTGACQLLTNGSLRDLQLYHRALGDSTRLRIVNLLATEGDLTVSALTRAVRVSQPLMSWHLRRLRRAGIIRTTRNGREVHCALDRERFADLQQRTFRVLMNRNEALG